MKQNENMWVKKSEKYKQIKALCLYPDSNYAKYASF